MFGYFTTLYWVSSEKFVYLFGYFTTILIILLNIKINLYG